MNQAQKVYLGAVSCPVHLRHQEPEWAVAKNTDLLWFLIPLIGIIFFIAIIEERYKREQ